VRIATIALIVLACAVAEARAQQWAEKMFDKTAHDFKVVARGSQAMCRFRVKNLYKETVNIAAVRSSCGCTTPSVEKRRLQTFETTDIVAQLDTNSFVGRKSATITVSFDEPFPAQVQLRVVGTIRSDVVISPGVVQLGAVEQGSVAEQRVTVSHSGRESWSLLDVQSTNSNFEVELDETGRGAGRVSYSVLVRLKDTAPVGYIDEDLVLVTNDPSAPQIPLPVEGRVIPDIVVSPASLYLGELVQGDAVTKKLIVRSKRPFKILQVNCEDDAFDFEISSEPKQLHIVNVRFSAAMPGKIEEKIRIQTDRKGGQAASLTAVANVKSPSPASGVE